MADLNKLQKKIGIEFDNKSLLKQSLVHRSYLNEHQDFPLGHNERLEFLGDAVLEIIVTEHLFKNYPDESEGELTNWRASLVNARMLSDIADEIGIEESLFLSKGRLKTKIPRLDNSFWLTRLKLSSEPYILIKESSLPVSSLRGSLCPSWSILLKIGSISIPNPGSRK